MHTRNVICANCAFRQWKRWSSKNKKILWREIIAKTMRHIKSFQRHLSITTPKAIISHDPLSYIFYFYFRLFIRFIFVYLFLVLFLFSFSFTTMCTNVYNASLMVVLVRVTVIIVVHIVYFVEFFFFSIIHVVNAFIFGNWTKKEKSEWESKIKEENIKTSSPYRNTWAHHHNQWM